MLHRTKIRHFVVEALRADPRIQNLVGRNVFDSKVTPFAGPKIPGINVVTPSQNGTSKSLNMLTADLTLKLNIEIYVKTMDGYQDEADAIAEAVEKALLCNPEFEGMTGNLQGYDVENSLYGDGAQPIVVQILSFTLTFSETWQAEFEDEFNKLHINVDVIEPIADPAPGPDGRIEFSLNVQP